MADQEKQLVVIGSDHGGFTLKEFLKSELGSQFKFVDVGCHSLESVDYPDYVKKGVEAMKAHQCRGIFVCGTGIGNSIAANKYKGIRAALAYNEYSAVMSRKHNDANVLCLGQRLLGDALALSITRAWLVADFEGGRHLKRLKKVEEIEKNSG